MISPQRMVEEFRCAAQLNARPGGDNCAHTRKGIGEDHNSNRSQYAHIPSWQGPAQLPFAQLHNGVDAGKEQSDGADFRVGPVLHRSRAADPARAFTRGVSPILLHGKRAVSYGALAVLAPRCGRYASRFQRAQRPMPPDKGARAWQPTSRLVGSARVLDEERYTSGPLRHERAKRYADIPNRDSPWGVHTRA
jgi:hypothetical protein